jgi:hypothetical protein
MADLPMVDNPHELSDELDDELAEDHDEHDDDAAPAHRPSGSAIGAHVATLSDRAIQRLVGGNAFIRGRVYARRSAVSDLLAEGGAASAHVRGRTDEPYTVYLTHPGEGPVQSQCSCPAWKGPTGHCKHVAALLVALRDRERPARPRPPEAAPIPLPVPAGANAAVRDGLDDDDRGGPGGQTVSAGGKRRRSRRRRRGAAGEVLAVGAAPVIEARPHLPAPELGPLRIAHAPQDRGGLDTWLAPDDANARPIELEYRLLVRAASIAVTPVLAGTRQSVPLVDALAAFNTIAVHDRPRDRRAARRGRRRNALAAARPSHRARAREHGAALRR